jgi:U3 small nucleolar RNA-associated protein 3
MGKRRNTAKTGDKGLYKARSQPQTTSRKKNDGDDDPMYNEVDRFHKTRDEDFLKLDQKSQVESEDEQEEAVMDLGLGGDSSGENSSDEDDEVDDRDSGRPDEASASEEEEELSVSSDDDDDEMELEDVRDWGKKKSAYYSGDTADLEIGQDEEDALVEEEAAKEVLAARYKDMSEDDFVLSDVDDKKKSAGHAAEDLVTSRDVSKFSTKEKQKLLDKHHPELLPLLSYFSGVVKDLNERTAVATKALFDGGKGTAEVCYSS